MPNRRDFLKNLTGAAAGVYIGGQIGAPPGKRRELSIGGRRVKTVDAHAHCFVPEVWDLVKNTPLAAAAQNNLTGNIALGNPQRLIDMDAQGIDYQAINVTPGGTRRIARWLVTLSSFRMKKFHNGVPGIRIGLWNGDRGAAAPRPGGRSVGGGRQKSWDCVAPPSEAASKARKSPTASSIRSGKGGATRRPALHASAKRAGHHSELAIAGKRRFGQHDWKSAGNHSVPLPLDF